MTGSVVTREDLQRVLDDIFRRVLDDGEQERASRESGPPPWTPEPQNDPRYEGLEPEEWDEVPYPPEIWTQDWRDAVMMNAREDVQPLLDDAMEVRRLQMPRDTVEWRRLSRLALIVAAQAHAINAKREWGDYGDGWPSSAGVPLDVMPSSAREAPTSPSEAVVIEPASPVPTLSESFGDFMRSNTNWDSKGRAQAEVALRKFVSLMGDLSVSAIRQADAEEFRNRLQKVPNLLGKSIYKGMSPSEAMTAANRLRAAINAKDGSETIAWRQTTLSRGTAERLAAPLTKKTINRDFTFFRSWGTWMKKNGERRAMLHDRECPFAGQGFSKTEVRKEVRTQGRERRRYEPGELAAIFASDLFEVPVPTEPSDAKAGQERQAKVWAILIGLYAGLRLGEIAMLRPSDFRVEAGIPRLRLTDDADRSFKSEAGARVVPLHPDLIRLGLMEFTQSAEAAKCDRLLPGMIDTEVQRGANISKWFTRFRRSVGLTSRQTVFHSFRHCFVAALRSKRGTDEVLADQIVGHDEYGSARQGYVGELSLALKAEAVAAIDYGIDLSALFTLAAQRDNI